MFIAHLITQHRLSKVATPLSRGEILSCRTTYKYLAPTARKPIRPSSINRHRILNPSNHHFVIGWIAPADCFRGVGVVHVLR